MLVLVQAVSDTAAQHVPAAAQSVPWVEVAKGVGSIAKTLALLVAGLWTYLIFVRQRLRYPGAKVELSLSHRELPNGKRILHVEVKLENIGKTIIRLDKADVVIERVAPLTADILGPLLAQYEPLTPDAPPEISWYRVGHRAHRYQEAIEIEPGECEMLRYDFRIGKNVKIVKVRAHITNCHKRKFGSLRKREKRVTEIGWSAVKYYELASQLPPSGVVHG